jgi:hypothetical protein
VLTAFFDVRQISVDVAGKHCELAARELKRVCTRSFEELAVVRDNQAAGAKLAQESFEEHLRAQIEEVGRFVQDQQIGIVQQQRRKLGAGLPAAGQLAHGMVDHLIRKLELPGHFATAPVGLAAVAHQKLADGFTCRKRVVLLQVPEAQVAATS